MRRGGQRHKLDTPGAGCQECERCVTFRHLPLDWTHPGWDRPQVIGHSDAAETILVRGLGYLCQCVTQVAGTAVPHVVVELKREFHVTIPLIEITDDPLGHQPARTIVLHIQKAAAELSF